MILRCVKCRRLLGYKNEQAVPPNKSKAILVDKCDCGRPEESETFRHPKE